MCWVITEVIATTAVGFTACPKRISRERLWFVGGRSKVSEVSELWLLKVSRFLEIMSLQGVSAV